MHDPAKENNDKLSQQRQELDVMTDKLINNLQSMIDEQTARANALAAHQHSLSPVARDVISASRSQPVSGSAAEPPLPVPPPPAAQPSPERYRTDAPVQQQGAAPLPAQRDVKPSPERKNFPKKARKAAPAPQKKKEEGNNVLSIIVFIVISIILMRCAN